MKDLREELGVATEQVQACGLPCGLPSLQVPSLVDQAAQRCLAEKEKENKAVLSRAPPQCGGDGWDPAGAAWEPVAGAAGKMRAVGAESQGLPKRMGDGHKSQGLAIRKPWFWKVVASSSPRSIAHSGPLRAFRNFTSPSCSPLVRLCCSIARSGGMLAEKMHQIRRPPSSPSTFILLDATVGKNNS